MGERSADAVRRLLFAEEGFSTVGMVVALLLTLSLVFTSAQVYQLESASAEVQAVADAAALAAEAGVAEFYVVVRLVDAVVLSLSLTAAATLGLGVVALCVPATATVATQLIDASEKIVKARNSFAEKAAEGLNRFQTALPFLCAASAAAVAGANSDGVSRTSYAGFALLAPLEGKTIEVGPLEGAQELVGEAKDSEEGIKQAAALAEEAAQEASEAKERGFMADCGRNPAYCMYERADALAGLPASRNPLYRSADAWSFSVALSRAQAYYAARLAAEAPQGSSVEEQARSALRERFYRYAVDEVSAGYVRDDETGFDAYFPLLPRNTSEMRTTRLYTEEVYPVTVAEGIRTMHAWAGCPKARAGQAAGTGSVAQMETEGMPACAACGFSASSLGKVAAASTSISNGFEYHYNEVARAAADYERARDAYQPHADAVKEGAGTLLEGVQEALGQAASYRIEASPPGENGCIAFVSASSPTGPSQSLLTSFVSPVAPLGARAALSAASLAEDDPEEGATVISSVLDSVSFDGALAPLGALELVLDLWSSLLGAYEKGADALAGGVEEALSSLPLVGESGLGQWAAEGLASALEAAGLAPAELGSPKPALVNSAHVLSACSTEVSDALLSAKGGVIAAGDLPAAGGLSQIVALAGGMLSGGQVSSDEVIDIATVAPFGEGGPSEPITVALPSGFAEAALAGAERAFAGFSGGGGGGGRRWE